MSAGDPARTRPAWSKPRQSSESGNNFVRAVEHQRRQLDMELARIERDRAKQEARSKAERKERVAFLIRVRTVETVPLDELTIPSTKCLETDFVTRYRV